MEADDRQSFARLAAPSAPAYRALLGAFVAAKRQFVVHLRPEDGAAALDRAGVTAPPDGAGPVADAAVALLDLLRDAGARLRHHGDLATGGLAITEHVLAAWGAEPWRMGAADYLAAVARTPGAPLRGAVADASWDPALAPALREGGVAVEEELVVADLLADLAP